MRQLGVAIAVAVLAGCSLTQPEEDPVQIKLRDLDGRVAGVERVVANQSLLDLARRIDALEADMRALHGQLEELQNANEALRKQQRDLYSDLDKRLSGGTAASPAIPPGPSPGDAGEQAAYAQAFDALKASNYAAAIGGFQKYLSAYPSGTLADNAQYWLGEAFYVTRDYEKAADAFRTVGQRWPDSRKAPDALLKLGYSQFELKRYDDARATLRAVRQRFPDSDAARLAGERLQRIPLDAH